MTQSSISVPSDRHGETDTGAVEISYSPSSETTQKDSTPQIILRSPRSPWWEFFLHFSTFGFYTNFWLYTRVKEIQKITNQPFTPWLWFFVPSLVIAQPFAFSKLNKILQQIEKENSLNYPANKYRLWVTSVIILSAISWASTKYAMPAWMTLLTLLLWSGTFCFFSSRLNTIKQALTDIEFKGKPSGYAFWEWFIVIPLFPLMLAGLLYLSVSPYMLDEISPLADKSIYTAPDNQFQLTIHGDGWREVEIGSFSDGSAELEFAGSTEGSYFLVFKVSKPTTLNEMIQNRMDYFQTETPNSQCREERSLLPSSLNVISHVVCEGGTRRNRQLYTTTVFEKDNELYELCGNLNAPRLSYPALSAEFKQMAKEFRPL